MKSVLKWCLLLLFANVLTAGEIRIAVAANVSYAIEDLKKAFHKSHPDTKVQVILGSSGKLTSQIRHGAPFGLFTLSQYEIPYSFV